jgi:dienelactone hydrolase
MKNGFKWMVVLCSAVFAAMGCYGSTLMPAHLPPPVDGTTWDLTSWQKWPFDYEELGARVAPASSGNVGDWTSIGDSWVAKNDSQAQSIKVRTIKPDFKDFNVTDFYITGGGNENGPNRVFCASAVPQGISGPFPVLFVFHGGGGHASGALALAIARKNPGFAAVAVDYNGQFRPSKSPVSKWVTVTQELKARKLDLIPNPLNFPMHHFAQASRRVLDWTDEQPWADKNRYGAVGISYGGWMSFFIAGNDERIKTIFTGVSAAGTEGMRGRACQPHDWQSSEQVPVWIAHADPAAYAQQTKAKVYLNLSSNDRFFWVDGAARQRTDFMYKAQWQLKPNSDHGNGGPELPDPSALWHRAMYMDETPFPTIGAVRCSAGTATAKIDSEKLLQAVYMAWAPGDAVSVARYYRWIKAEKDGDSWSAPIPESLRGLNAIYYYTAIDEEGRSVSSDLLKHAGADIAEALVWKDGCLWDLANGAAAWRSDLAGDRPAIEEAGEGRVKFVPTAAGKRVAVLSNSFVVKTTAKANHKGIRIELGGNGKRFKTNVVLSRDYQSLDMQKFAAEIEVSEEVATYEIPWDSFKKFERETNEENNLPANGLVLITTSMPGSGLTVGRVEWLD